MSGDRSRGWAWLMTIVLAGCASSAAPASPSREAPKPEASAEAVLESGLWDFQPPGTECAAEDICGHFLQLISPGSDAAVLGERALGIARGKCSGHVIAYKDRRHVLGAGVVLASEADKRACEAALGREEDTDFRRALVWRRVP